MFRLFILLTTVLAGGLRALLRSRSDLVLENVALRQQVEVLKRRRPRPQLDDADRAFWLAMRTAWRGWAARLILVRPDTVVRWHRDRFRRYWSKLSRQDPGLGRPRVDREVRDVDPQDDPGERLGCSPDPRGTREARLHRVRGHGLTLHAATPCECPDVVQRWLAFLRNHVEGIAAMDFFTLPTASLRVLYCWFVIHHQHRRVLHFNATFNPSPAWVIQQLREAFPYDTAPRYLIFDRDSIFSRAVVGFVKSMGTKPHRTAYRSPWQNPIAERWIGGCRRELFDHVIVFNELHAVRLARAYIGYFHEDRTHLGLDKETPCGRPETPRPSSIAQASSRLPRVGGLHHRYEWREAA